MTLSKRAAFLIFPVILAGYIFTATQVYFYQTVSIAELEKSRVDYHVANLKGAFVGYQSFLSGLLLNIGDSQMLKQFLNEKEDRYRNAALASSLSELISAYQYHRVEFATLSILSSDGEVLYYYEKSRNPFARIRPENINLAKQLVADNQSEFWRHSVKGESSTLTLGRLLDTRTFSVPFPGEFESSVVVLVSLKLSDYDVLIKQLLNTYPATITYGHAIQDNIDKLTAQVSLAENYYLTAAVGDGYLKSIEQQLLLFLSAGVVALSLMTFFMLIYLIRRNITQPIALLDQQLAEVMAGERDNIETPTGNDEVYHLASTFHDLYGRLSSLLQETTYMSRTDVLTDLPNRLSFQDFAEEALVDVGKRSGRLSFIYIDLDNFKFVNDKYGHDVGDQLLRAFVIRLKHLLTLAVGEGQQLLAARLSGDEFIIAAVAMTQSEVAHLAEKILKLFDNGFSFERGSFPVTVSLGVAAYPNDGHTVSQLISNSDLAMYQAKKKGKNRFEFYSLALAESSRRSMDIEDQLKACDYDGEFHLVYMPIMSNRGVIEGCEVLLRWRSPQLGNIGPDEFIPIAEATGLFERIDFWVVEKAFQSYDQLKSSFGDDFRLAINISSAHLGTDGIYYFLVDMLDRYEVPPGQIELEITETFSVEQTPGVLALLARLRARGLKIAIDDFGSGYTSLMQMVDYPADNVKLDKAFIARISENNDKELVAALIRLCHIQGMTVTAEGIETAAQSRLLISAGCDCLQGYYYSKPLELSAVCAREASIDVGLVPG